MADKHFEFFEHLDFEFMHDEREIIERGFQDKLMRLEGEFNFHIDECVEYGSYSYERGEELKRAHKITLWAGHITTEEA